MRGLAGVIAAARAARGNRDARLVQRQQELDRLALHPLEAQTDVSGQAAEAMADQVGVADRLLDRVDQEVADLHQPGGLVGHFRPRDFGRAAQGDDAGHVLRAGAASVFLPAAGHERRQLARRGERTTPPRLSARESCGRKATAGRSAAIAR